MSKKHPTITIYHIEKRYLPIFLPQYSIVYSFITNLYMCTRDCASTRGKYLKWIFITRDVVLYTRSDVRHIKTYGSHIHYYVENGELIFIVFKHNFLYLNLKTQLHV